MRCIPCVRCETDGYTLAIHLTTSDYLKSSRRVTRNWRQSVGQRCASCVESCTPAKGYRTNLPDGFQAPLMQWRVCWARRSHWWETGGAEGAHFRSNSVSVTT